MEAGGDPFRIGANALEHRKSALVMLSRGVQVAQSGVNSADVVAACRDLLRLGLDGLVPRERALVEVECLDRLSFVLPEPASLVGLFRRQFARVRAGRALSRAAKRG